MNICFDNQNLNFCFEIQNIEGIVSFYSLPLAEDENLQEKKDDKDEEALEDEDDDILGAVKEHQTKQNSNTCMTRREPEALVIENHTNKTIKKKRNSKMKDGIDIAPGENKIPTNFMRDEHFDVKAFPTLHPTGNYGLNHPRDQKLPPVYYFNQRLLNEDQRFAKHAPYLFAAQQYVERTTLEGQINISGLKGQRDGTTSDLTRLTDPFSVFQKLKGSPRYWKQAKDELIAKVKQLGPFHIFFTLSCAELRWFEIFVSILKQMGVKVIEGKENEKWNGKADDIMVNGKSLWLFISEMKEPKYKLLKDKVIMITRMFDHRIRSFIKHILMGNGTDIKFDHYSYRIEFQGRGLPHLHGVLWLCRKFLNDLIGEKVTLQGSREHQKIIDQIVDKLITCKIPDVEDKEEIEQVYDISDEENEEKKKEREEEIEKKKDLKNKVLALQVHNHTKTCTKHGTVCRFGFPRYPSKETLISEPAEDRPEFKNLDKDEKKTLLDEYRKILEKVKKALEDKDLDDNQTLKTFLDKLEINSDEYHNALRTSERGRVLVLERTLKERNINNYNPEWLTAWVGLI